MVLVLAAAAATCMLAAARPVALASEPPAWWYEGMPPHEVPTDLLDGFTMGGRIPIARMYVDDSAAGNGTQYRADRAMVERLVEQFKATVTESRWVWLLEALEAYPVDGEEVAVFGSIEPFAEALLLAKGASMVTTVEYNQLRYEHPQLVQVQPAALESVNFSHRFAAAVALSSFDHDGLGRYGDPVGPDGDLRAMRAARRCLRRGGLLFLSVPVGPDLLVWNLHRRYGPLRLPRLLQGWESLRRFGWEEWRLTAEAPFRRSYEPLHVLQPMPGPVSALKDEMEL